MKLLIAGSRSIKEYDFKKYIPEGTTLIITGGAAGVDTLAEKYADELGLSKLIIRPKYDVYGKFKGTVFVDTYNDENSRDFEPVRGPLKDDCYNMLVDL